MKTKFGQMLGMLNQQTEPRQLTVNQRRLLLAFQADSQNSQLINGLEKMIHLVPETDVPDFVTKMEAIILEYRRLEQNEITANSQG